MGKFASAMPSINLAKKKGIWIDTFIFWALNIGRVIIIITEGIALVAFLSRFSLDKQIIDLHGKIKQEQAIVALLKHNEETYRNLQDRLALIDTLDKQSNQQTKLYFTFLGLLPSNVQINRYDFTSKKIQFEVYAQSTSALGEFINNLKKNSLVTSISIDKIENRVSDATIVMAITANLKTNL